MTIPPARPPLADLHLADLHLADLHLADLDLAWRDLRWLLLSPPLLDAGATQDGYPCDVQHFSPGEVDAIERWLHGVITEPAGRAALAEHLTQTAPRARGASPRLGHRAEHLMAFFLQHGPTHRGVASHIALREPLHASARPPARTTLGEIDFLVRDGPGQGWHWELAVKFYLCTASGPHATWADFVGPNRADSLDAKLRKMFDQQLRHAVPPPWNTEPWRPAACVRGRLFYRYGAAVPLTPGLNPAHLQGRWIERARLPELTEGDWQCLPPSAWMASLPADDRHDALRVAGSVAALGECIDALWQRQRASGGVAGATPRRAVMAVRRAHPSCGHSEPAGTELERLFVVPDGWPLRVDD